MALQPGEKLGPYEITAPIGKGGMGEVYSAHDSRTGRDVAIKISAERFSERFDREVRAVAALNHPNICTLFDVGPDYLVMELIEGDSPKGPLPLDEALRIARQIASALEDAHEKGIIHRDLKPGNLALVDRKDDVAPLKNLPPGSYSVPRVSRDGKRVAYQIDDGKESSIWIYELSETGAPRRLTLPGTGNSRDPIWSPDGKRIAFRSDREGDAGIFWQLADGSAPAERVTKPEKGIAHIPDSWSPDGQTLSFTEEKRESSAVWTYSLREKKATLFAQAPGFLRGSSVFSPDGRWIAYQESNSAANRRELSSIVGRVYVQPFPSGTKYQAPQDQDTHHPLWSPDGKELFYAAGPSLLGSVSVSTQPSPSFGSPVRAPKVGFNTAAPGAVRPYDILPDGKHFIGVVNAGQTQTGGGPPQIQVVLNWFEDVKQRASVGK
jgi:serine/threonine protein kinase